MMKETGWLRLFKPVIHGRIGGRVRPDVTADQLACGLADMLRRDRRIPVRTGNRVECDDNITTLLANLTLYAACGHVALTVDLKPDGRTEIHYILNFWRSWTFVLILYQPMLAALIAAAILGHWRGALMILLGFTAFAWFSMVALTLIRQYLAVWRLLRRFH